MSESNQENTNEILLNVYQSHRQEALQHRQTILNVFMLVFAGFIALAAALVAQDALSIKLKWCLTVAAAFALVLAIVTIAMQRAKTEESMDILRKIEKKYRLFEKGAFVEDDSVLPDGWAKSPTKCYLTSGDWLHVTLLIIVAFVVIVLAWCIPTDKLKEVGSQQGAPPNQSTAAPSSGG